MPLFKWRRLRLRVGWGCIGAVQGQEGGEGRGSKSVFKDVMENKWWRPSVLGEGDEGKKMTHKMLGFNAL